MHHIPVWTRMSLRCYSWRGNSSCCCFFPFSTQCTVCVSLLFSFVQVPVTDKGESLTTHQFFCQKILLRQEMIMKLQPGSSFVHFFQTVLLVNPLIDIPATTFRSCHIFKWLIYPTVQLFLPGECPHSRWPSLPRLLVISTSQSDIKQLAGSLLNWPSAHFEPPHIHNCCSAHQRCLQTCH